jgi:hypothetical protein
VWIGEPLTQFHGVLTGTPMVMSQSGGAQSTSGHDTLPRRL